MTWIATVQDVSVDGGNAVVVVNFTDDATGKSFQDKTFGDNLTLDLLKDWAAKRIDSLTDRDSAVADLSSLKGQVLTPQKAPTDSPELIAFRASWARLAAIRRLNSASLTDLENSTVKDIETYLAQNPDAIDDPFLMR